MMMNPFSYWRFDETSGTVAFDETNRNPGEYQGVALNQAPAPGLVGSSVLLDGTDGKGGDIIVSCSFILIETRQGEGKATKEWERKEGRRRTNKRKKKEKGGERGGGEGMHSFFT